MYRCLSKGAPGQHGPRGRVTLFISNGTIPRLRAEHTPELLDSSLYLCGLRIRSLSSEPPSLRSLPLTFLFLGLRSRVPSPRRLLCAVRPTAGLPRSPPAGVNSKLDWLSEILCTTRVREKNMLRAVRAHTHPQHEQVPTADESRVAGSRSQSPTWTAARPSWQNGP